MTRREQLHERLASAPFTVVGRFMDASNATLLVRLDDVEHPDLDEDATLSDLDAAHLAVYKPAQGEAPLWDFPDGTLHQREVAASEVDHLLGWGLVPLTILREDGPHGVGSLQAFAKHRPDDHYFTLRDAAEQGEVSIRMAFERMVLFDLIVNNADRKGGHAVMAEDGIALFDHGVCFHVEDKLRTVAWDYVGERPFDADLADVARLVDALSSYPDDGPLRMLLSASEFDALVARAETVAGLTAFPAPTSQRPYPWPLL